MPQKHKIYFRADAGPKIGYGHFIRTLALVDMLKEDFECSLYTQTPTEYQLHEAEDICPLVSLPADDSKFNLFLSQLQGDEIVVLDNYFFSTEYQRVIKDKGCKVVCIDDMHDKHYVANVVINHGVEDSNLFDIEPYTKLCLGYNYALLRKPFISLPKSHNRQKGLVLVCFGGSDPYNLTKRYIEQLIKYPWVEQIVAVVGDGYPYRDELVTLYKTEIRARLSASQMADLFCRAECVVCSASSTAYEAIACGATVYAGWYIDNQKDFYHHLCATQAIVPLGNLLESHLVIDRHAKTKSICLDVSKSNLRKVFWQLVLRQINYTEMSESESRAVWKTRNLPQIRQWMLHSNPFSWENHLQFIANLTERNDKQYFAFFNAEQFVASYDLTNIHNGEAECGLYLHPDYIGKGIATIVEERMEEIASTQGIHTLISQVMNTNTASLSFFTRNGFLPTGQNEHLTYFEKQI